MRQAMRVYVVSEGETYHVPWIAHGVFSCKEEAEAYAAELVRTNEAQRWSNVSVSTFELNTPGFVQQKVLPVPPREDR